MFVNPERFRYHYIVDYIHNNRTNFRKLMNDEIDMQEYRESETRG
jgi:hypothetical protein